MGPHLKGCHRKRSEWLLLLFFLIGFILPGYSRLDGRDAEFQPGSPGEALLVHPGAQTSYLQPGRKIIKNYTRKNYGIFLHPQNWWIIQDRRGIIYVANHAALLEYDGVTWRLIKVLNWTVRSLTLDETGRLYIGGNNEIGYLAPDDKGNLNYVSLMDHVPKEKRNFSSVWRCHEARGNIYFLTSKLLLRWNPGSKQLKTWESDSKFISSFVYNGMFCLQVEGLGILRMVNDSLELLPGTQAFARQKIYFAVPYDPPFPGRNPPGLLLGTRENGLFLYGGSKVLPFSSEAVDYLSQNNISHGIPLSSSPGDFALGTHKGGLVIFDSAGRLKRIFNKANGLLSDNVKYVYEDRQGNLWLALDKGIARIESATPFSVFDDRSGLSGNFLSLVKYGPEAQENCYAGTTDGLFVLADSQRFQPVKELPEACWAMLPVNDRLLVAARNGVFQINRQFTQIAPLMEREAFALYTSRRWPRRVWVGAVFGLASLYLENNRWKKEFQLDTLSERIRSIAEDHHGNLWLGTLTQGAIKLEFPADILHPLVTRYNSSHGLPPGEIYVANAGGRILFATEKGLYRFDNDRKRFLPDPLLGDRFCDGSRQVFRLVEDKQGNIWFYSLFRNFQAKPGSDGSYTLTDAPFRGFPISQVNSIYPDPDGHTVWFVGNDSIIRYDSAFKKDYQRDFPVYIRSVTVNGAVDQGSNLLFNGYRSGNRGSSRVVLPHRERNLRIEFAAPFFEEESETEYQWRLEGYDPNWCPWDLKPHTLYTNLDSGEYTFRVRARNIYEHISREARFSFRILPPWTRTWWAFSLYILTGLMLVYGIVRWRSGQLQREKRHLETVVKDRTTEINEKNIRLENQSRQLQEMDELKSRFFANLSHEFRTPLTLIMGPLEQMLSNARDKEQRKKIASMYRHSRRLLFLINQLLDLAKFDSGKMKLEAVCRDIVSLLKDVCASFELLATQHKIELRLTAAEEKIMLYFDPGRLEQVLSNLLLNAVKFTPPGGTITVKVLKRNQSETDSPFSSGWLEISVRDTGTGIPTGQIPYIFDRFYQAGSSDQRNRVGTGIGLALVKELVTLHHGEIDVHSHNGEDPPGTEFVIRLPLGNAHLLPGEIAVESETASPGALSFNGPTLYFPGTPPPEQPVEPGNAPEDEPGTKTGREDKEIILVVDDNEDLRRYIKGALQPDYAVMEAREGEEGIRKARKLIPDLIISDVVMPGMDGYRLCALLKSEITTSHIPVILLTARAAEENILKGLETGADDYITKPFNTKLLLARVRNLIQLRRQLQLHMKRELKLQPAAISVSSLDREFIKELLEVIDKNLSDPDFSVEVLQRKLFMSRSTLYRKIHALSGVSPVEFIRSYRLKRAAQLLGSRQMTITDVAFQVGFSSSAYFTKCFKEQFQQLPSVYQGSTLRDN
jgi:signal transduction histidine kinase/DNA-binding response OmpR family regulator